MVGIARQVVFKRAVKAKHIAENPFADDELPTSIGNREKEYVSAEAVQQALAVLAVCRVESRSGFRAIRWNARSV
jgi:hypothetical protein